MIKSLDIRQYKKLKNIKFEFGSMNLISGANGTCKTTILHMISNSFQKQRQNNPNLLSKHCIQVLNSNNVIVNAKIERLVRDFRQSVEYEGNTASELFTVNYADGRNLSFRKHVSKNAEVELGKDRYSIKPPHRYKGENLPFVPSIYLSLSRLLPVGEIDDLYMNSVERYNFPDEYLELISDLYRNMIGLEVIDIKTSKMEMQKAIASFASNTEGIDSNTISSGEDNLFIIIRALVSLKYYFDSCQDKSESQSVLCIDEFDATLHPSLQVDLFDLIDDFSEKYNIQVFLTTHSLYLLKHAINKKRNVFYLINERIDSVLLMEDLSIYKIEQRLKRETHHSLNQGKKIPIFMEDDEARLFLDKIFEYYKSHSSGFSMIVSFFHFVDCKIGSEGLKSIFNDSVLRTSNVNSFCILDGDQESCLTNRIITLPGKANPEQIIFEHAKKLIDPVDRSFWYNTEVDVLGFSVEKFENEVLSRINDVDLQIEKLKSEGKKTKGLRRQKLKDILIDPEWKAFFEFVIIDWIQKNPQVIKQFMKNVNCMFKRTSPIIGLNPSLWNEE